MPDDTTNSERGTAAPIASRTNADRTLDLAVVIALGTAYLYILAWVYWSAYFRVFGLPSDLVEIRVDTVVAAVWPFAAGVLFLALIHLRDVLNFPSLKDAKIQVADLLVLASTLVIIWVDPEWLSHWARWVAWVGLLVVMGFVMYRTRGRTVAVHRSLGLDKRSERVFIVALIAVLTGGMFSMAGGRRAHYIATGRTRDRVTVETRGTSPLPSELSLVAIARGKVVVSEPKRPNPQPQAIILDEAEIVRITTYRKP